MSINLPLVCRYLLIALVVTTLAGMLVPSIVCYYLPVRSGLGAEVLQIWRYATYPFVIEASVRRIFSAIFSLGWIYLMLSYFGAELETIIHPRKLLAGLVPTTISAGIVFVLTSKGYMAGPGVIVMYLVTAFAYLWPNREISVFGFFWVKAWVIAIAILLISLVSPFDATLSTNGHAFDALVGPLLGAIGALVYMHLSYRQYSFASGVIDSLSPMAHKAASVVGASTRGVSSRGGSAGGTLTTQERIDLLLDKISKEGMKSLTKEEHEFLINNSK